MGVYVGTSGWSYEHWKGVLYPRGMPAAQRLRHYAETFTTTELNGSFYHWPRQDRFAQWRRDLPAGFQLSVKAPRGLTHARRLQTPEVWLGRIAACWQELDGRRGALLVQLPPDFDRDDARLSQFLRLVPPGIRVAMEFRHPSWHDDHVFALLEGHQAGYCVMSGAQLPCVLRVTAPFAYVRLHGPDQEHLYGGSYRDADLAWWADRIGEWTAAGKDVFAYFNNDAHGHAVRNAVTLQRLVASAEG